MPIDRDELLAKMRAEREEIVERLNERSAALDLDLGAFTPMAIGINVPLDDRSTPIVVISLEGLRRIDAITSELEQLREILNQKSAPQPDPGVPDA